MHSSVTHRPRWRWTALALLAPLAVVGCGGSGSKSSDSATLRSADSAAGPPAAAVGGKAAASGAAAGNPQTPLQQRDIVRTATLDVTVRNVDRAADSAVASTVAFGGRADGDDRTSSDTGRRADLVLRVPPAKLEALLAAVVRLGHENNRTDHGEDVTSARADVDSRVQTLNTSVARLRDFLQKSGSITDLVALESQLTQRESELESTVAQQRALADQVGLASLTVQLSSTGPVSAHASGPSGFGSALTGGLSALLLVLRWSGAVLGYALPLLLGALLVLLPLALWWRRRGSRPVPVVEPLTE
ncbi:MAG: DUF4349 domain-containing protein [Jatrophihabitans sp.]